MKKIAFIGAGNMNAAIIGGLVKKGWPADDIIVSNPSAEKRLKLAELYNINQTKNNIQAAEFADIIVLGVKPYLIAEVCQELSENLDISDKCFLSVAAGGTIAQIQTALVGKYPVIRTMPNTPSQLGLGMTGMFASIEVTQQQRQLSEEMMSAVGETLWLDTEEEINHIISISGSGPAYFFLFMEAMEEQASELGFSKEVSRLLVQQTALGAAKMVTDNPELEISQLRTNVTSKGGTTQAALDQLIEGGLKPLVTKGIQGALSRAREMAKDNQ